MSLRQELKQALTLSKRSATSGPGREWDVADVMAVLAEQLALHPCERCGARYTLETPAAGTSAWDEASEAG